MNDLLIPKTDWEATPRTVQELVVQLASHVETSARAVQQAQGLVQQVNSLQTSISDGIRRCAALASKRRRTKKQVVFVSDHPTARQAKLAFGMKQNGWEVILLHREPPAFDASRYYDEIVQYLTEHHAAILASMYSPTAYHVFSSWGFSTARAIVEARPGKIVFDSYDCLGGGLQGQVASESQAQVESEKFCFEHADATCHRSSNWYVRRRYGYKMAKPIFFPEYSWGGDENLGIPKKPKRTDGIHCLYVGSVEPQNFNDPTKRTNVHDAEFVRSLTDRGVHYHIFPWVYDPDPQKFLNKYAPMLEEQVRNPLFHLHPPHQYEIMMEEISALHFGIIQVSPDVVTNGNHYYTANVFRHTTMNKVFDYIDADLFTLSFGYRTAERVLRGACEIVPRMEVGEWASKITPQEFKKKFLPRIPHVVDRLSVVKQARRLASFYESL